MRSGWLGAAVRKGWRARLFVGLPVLGGRSVGGSSFPSLADLYGGGGWSSLSGV